MMNKRASAELLVFASFSLIALVGLMMVIGGLGATGAAIRSAKTTTTTQITTELLPLQLMSIEGTPMTAAPPRVPFVVVGGVKSLSSTDQPFVAVLEIKDSAGVTVSLQWVAGTLGPQEQIQFAYKPIVLDYESYKFVNTIASQPPTISPGPLIGNPRTQDVLVVAPGASLLTLSGPLLSFAGQPVTSLEVGQTAVAEVVITNPQPSPQPFTLVLEFKDNDIRDVLRVLEGDTVTVQYTDGVLQPGETRIIHAPWTPSISNTYAIVARAFDEPPSVSTFKPISDTVVLGDIVVTMPTNILTETTATTDVIR